MTERDIEETSTSPSLTVATTEVTFSTYFLAIEVLTLVLQINLDKVLVLLVSSNFFLNLKANLE